MEKLITIITATFNAGRTLQAFFDSIVPMKVDDVELVIIDGGSDDCTLEVIKKNQRYVDKFVSDKDRGIYDAWNKGIQMSSGKWIMFLGADDILLPTFANYIKFIRNQSLELDIITAKAEYRDCAGKIIKIIGAPYSWSKYRKNMQLAHGTTLHNKNLFKELGTFDISYKICADYELLMRKGKCLNGAFYNCPIMNFYIGGASFSVSCQEETFKIRKKYHSVSLPLNIALFIKRIIGIAYKKMVYKIDY